MINGICIYCGETKPLVLWRATGEMVCYDCRIDFLDQEFEEAKKIYKKEII